MVMSEKDDANDGRMSFDEAVRYVKQQPGRAAFAAAPVFGERSDDAEQRAEGARVFIIEADRADGWRVRFVGGPFFSNVFGANEIIAAAEVPERVRELRFLPSRFEESWLDGQVQVLIQKLMQANGNLPSEMPDYASAPTIGAGADAVFPISFVGRDSENR
jgi:hypothetical protein